MNRAHPPKLRRVLVVDYSHEVLEQIRQSLRSLDAAVSLSVACSIDDAREYLSKTTPDLVIATADWVDAAHVDGVHPGRQRHYPVIALVEDRRHYDKLQSDDALDYVVRTQAGLAELPHIVRRTLREWALATNNQRLMDVVDVSPDFVGAADPDGKMLFVNEGGRRMVGLDKNEDVTGRRLHEFFPGWSVKMMVGDNFPAGQKHPIVNGVPQPVHLEERDIQITVRAHLSVGGEIEFFSVHATRSTNERDGDGQLRRRLETIGKLASGIAHDINNTLVPIIGQAELAFGEVTRDGALRERLSAILRAADRTRQLTRQIVSFGSPAPAERKRARAVALIGEAINIAKAALPKTIRLQRDLPQKCGTVVVDTPQIYQLVVSLCLRSIESIAGKGMLTVSLKRTFVEEGSRLSTAGLAPGVYAQLTIRESPGSPGVPEEPAVPLSKREMLSDHVLTEAQKIAASHNGAILGHGYPGGRATITVYLPIVDDNGDVIDEPTSVGNKKILVVDDEDAVTKTIEQLLRRDGYQVTAKTNPVDALQIFCTNPERFDLVIADQEMRDVGGEQLSTLIRRVRQDVLIIETTAYNKGVAHQPRGFLQKPFSAIELREALRSAFTI